MALADNYMNGRLDGFLAASHVNVKEIVTIPCETICRASLLLPMQLAHDRTPANTIRRARDEPAVCVVSGLDRTHAVTQWDHLDNYKELSRLYISLSGVCIHPGVLQVSSAIDSESHRPAFPRKILHIQLARVQDAVQAMERCVASVSHPGLRQKLVKPVDVSKGTLRALERLGTSVALAQLIDAADALCMLGVGMSAITQQCGFPLTIDLCPSPCVGLHLQTPNICKAKCCNVSSNGTLKHFTYADAT